MRSPAEEEAEPLVSVVIPMLDEERDIEGCLDAVRSQDYPLDRIEVLVVDGGSRDASASLAERSLASMQFLRGEVISNVGGNTPSNLNRGLEAAGGDVVVRIDARSRIPAGYIRKIVEVLRREEIAVVGGAQIADAGPDASLVAEGIARALRNPYLTGGSRYRRNRSSGPSDTAYLGAFRRPDLEAAGGWDERLATNQDYELNRRLSRSGTVWFERSLQVAYRPRATYGALFTQYRRFGRWKAAGWIESGGLTTRHALIIAGAGVGGALFLRLARRRPVRAVLVTGAGLLGAEAVVGERGTLPLRAASALASGISVGAWLAGVAEQSVRALLGERMLSRKSLRQP